MKKKIFQKAVSFTAAAAIGCTSLIGTGFVFQAFAEEETTPALSAESEMVLAESIKPGLYINDMGIRQITEDTIAYISFGDGHWQDTPYTLENGILTTKSDVCQVQQVDENTLLFIFTTRDFTESMTYIGEGSLEDYHVYSTLEVVKRVKDVVENVLGYDSSRLVNTPNNNILTLSVFGTKDGQEENLGYYKLDIFTGEVLESTEGLPDLSPITFNDFEKDKVLMYVSNGKIYYLDFHSGKMISQEDGTEIPASYVVNKATLQFSMNPFDGTETAVNCQNYSFPNASSAVLTAKMNDETIRQIVLKPVGTYDTFKFYNNQELASMAKTYYQSQHSDYTGEPQITVNDDATVTIQMTETESYTVNPFTGTGFNQAQEEIDLTSGQPEIVLAESFKPGLYINDLGIRQITEDTIAYISFGDGHWQDTPYTLENGILTTKSDVCQVQQVDENTLLFIFTTRDFTESMTYIGEGSLEDYHVYSTLEVVKRVKDVVENVLGYDSSRLENTSNNNILTLSVFGTKDGQEENLGYYKLDIFTGEVLESTEGLPDLFPITFNDFEKDKVLMYVSDGKIYYLDFSSGKMISQEDGTEIPASYAVNKATLQFSMNPFDGTETAVNCQNYSFPNASSAVLTAKMNDETIRQIVLKPVGTYDTFKFYNHQELASMAKTYYQSQHSDYTGEPQITVNDDATVTIQMTETETYTIDPLTAVGTDLAGNPVDIKQALVPEIPENAYSLEQLEKMACIDYEKKTGIAPDSTETSYQSDGSVLISFSDAEKTCLDQYTVDPVTGTGTNQKGEQINLPQTGNSNPAVALQVGASAFGIFAGIFAMWKSGIFRKKKEF